MTCSSCGAANKPGRRFCVSCGAALARACAQCGAIADPEDRFCGECGASLEVVKAAPSRAKGAAEEAQPVRAEARPAERRLVSVLFADLVGFTSLSEKRDAEEVRDLLSRYFDTCRRLIGRYGGTVEKFIGDAVMAVWGAPLAQEDDAERAVRAGIDLVSAVEALGSEIGMPSLRARAGILTGEAAVMPASVGEGMVAGDLVNTASRVQSVAQPGDVLVGDSTRRATDASIAYEDAGLHEVKGKAEKVQVWRAVRVVGGLGGAQKAAGLEPPFVGRDRELRLMKDLFHASAEEKKAHVVSVMGVAGVGKSRLAWEFFKYIDGVAERIFWHRGRCLSYGEGVAYWALAEMVRMRARIVEEEDQASAAAKLHAALEQYIADSEERRWLEPRLAHLLGLEEHTTRDREDLFSAWRLFFERLAEREPTILVFEDLQWADRSLVDFIEYLLDWSRDHPLFVVGLARPEIAERHPGWASGKRSFTSLFLEPLPPAAMEALISGTVPGLPEDLRRTILERAEGIPLYAVETVRMLIDRGLLVREGDGYVTSGPVETLAVPETLHALITARLDGLPPDERLLLQDASVLGKTFTQEALASVSRRDSEAVEGLLASLVRKEFLAIQSDPRSPEHGQYGFLQDLVKRVAHDMLSKKDRKARHLAVAAYYEETWRADDGEIVEVVAAHYLDAYHAAPDAEDAPAIKAKARSMLIRAGERAASLAASGEAARYYEHAAELAEDDLERASILDRAGEMAWTGGQRERAKTSFERALEIFRREGKLHPAARVSARHAEVIRSEGATEEAIVQMEEAFGVLSDQEPDGDIATLAAQLGRIHFFIGDLGIARERLEFALEVAEALWIPEVLSEALNSKANILASTGHQEEAMALMERALTIARENEVPAAMLRAYNNLGHLYGVRDRYEECLVVAEDGLVLARKLGNRFWEEILFDGHIGPLVQLGRWDEALRYAQEEGVAEDAGQPAFDRPEPLFLMVVLLARGELDAAERMLSRYAAFGSAEDVQARTAYFLAEAQILHARGQMAESMERAGRALDAIPSIGPAHPLAKMAFAVQLEAGFDAGDVAAVERTLARIRALPPGDTAVSVRAHEQRFRARLAATAGDHGAEAAFKAATAIFDQIGFAFPLAVARLEYAEWLAARGRAEEATALAAEASATFQDLRATPWVTRAQRATSVPA